METSNTFLSTGSRMEYKHSEFTLSSQERTHFWLMDIKTWVCPFRPQNLYQCPTAPEDSQTFALNPGFLPLTPLAQRALSLTLVTFRSPLVFHLENSLMRHLRFHNHEPTSLKNDWMSTIYPSQAIIKLVFLTYLYTSTYVLINHLLIYLMLRLPAEKMMHIITK